MLAMFNNQPIFGPRGPAGPDGNPIGTIISYMGIIAPKDYLICDGSTYNISDYSKLAEFFKTQFGSSNYFGGNGTTTFAVPDMRNLFLRGFHGSTTSLSGSIGKKQEATEHPNVQIHDRTVLGLTSDTAGKATYPVKNSDTETVKRQVCWIMADSGSDEKLSATYTSRPVNMAVLYCIKCTVSNPYENIYSTEEVCIGTWVNGKPLYRKMYLFNVEEHVSNTITVAENIKNIDTITNVFVQATAYIPSSDEYAYLTSAGGDFIVMPSTIEGNTNIYCEQHWLGSGNGVLTFSGSAAIEYTKTTDL